MADIDYKKIAITSGAACWPVAGKTFSLHGLMSRPTDNLWVEGIDHGVSTENIPAKATDAWSPFHKA